MIADGAMDARGRVYEDGPHRSGPHADSILLQRKNSFPALSKRKTYADALCSWVGQRHSIFCGKVNASGPAYLCNLEGPLPAGGEFVEPRSVQDPSEDEVASPELPTVHEPLMIAPERLVVACVSDCCSPSSLVDEVDIITPLLLLHKFIKSLDLW